MASVPDMTTSLSAMAVDEALLCARAGTWDVDLRDDRVRYSDSCYRMLGIEPRVGEGMPRFWRERVHPEDAERVLDSFRGYIQHPLGQWEQEYRLRHADGHWIWVLARGRARERDFDGSALRLSGFMLDFSERQQQLDDLKTAEYRYRQATSVVRGMIYEMDMDTNRISQTGLNRLIGWDVTDDVDAIAEWFRTLHPEDLERVQNMVESHHRSGAPYDTMYRALHADGHYIHIWHRGTYLKDGSGKVTRAFGVAEDVTSEVQLRESLRNAEQALRQSQKTLRTVADASPVHLALFDCQRRCVFANHSLAGAGAEDLVGRRLEEMMPEGQVGEALQLFEQVVGSGRGAEITQEIQFPGRAPVLFHIHLQPVHEEGQVAGVVVNMADVTESRKLAVQQHFQAGIIERMREGVVLLRRDATMLFTNPAFDAMFGFPVGALLGRSVRELSFRPNREFDEFARLTLTAVDMDRSSLVEFEGRHRDGSSRTMHCLLSGIPLGNERCVLGVLTDVTEQKALQRELLQVEARVQHQIGSELHDGLGQQLAGVAMILKSLQGRIAQTSDTGLHRDVQGVIDQVNLAMQSTRSLARGLAPVRTDRQSLIEGFEELAQQVMDTHGVKVNLALDLPANVRLDENTASNLYRIAQEGILNAARHGRARHIDMRIIVRDSEAELTVSDDGQGFDPNDSQGGGMGLRVMRFRAQMLNGFLSVESRVGGGTTLRCHCPLRPGAT